MTNRRPPRGSNMAEAALKIETPIDPRAAAAATGGLPKFEAADVFHDSLSLHARRLPRALRNTARKSWKR